MKSISHVFLCFLIGISFTACSKENYIYVQKAGNHTDKSYPVKEMQGSSSVDILWVIDNSGSMSSYQQQVVTNSNAFMQDFIKQQLNWKMGLISTDKNDHPYAGFSGSAKLDASVADPVGTFQLAVNQLGTDGDSTERTFTPIVQSLTNDPNFLRPNTPLAVIMVTDAEEQSSITAKTFVSQLSLLTQGRNIFAYGVYASADFGCDSSEGAWNYKGSPYEGFISTAMNGQTFPLCKDFGTSLVNIAHDIVTRVAYSAIYLKGRPDTSTLQVIYQGKELPPGPTEAGGYWTYDYRLNAVVFNNLDFAKNDTDSVRVLFEEEN